MRTRDTRTVAMIDIGTNSTKMVVARVAGDGSVRPVHFAKATPRIGQAMTSSGGVSRDGVDRVVSVLGEFAREAEAHGAEGVFAFSTFALRRATNASSIVGLIEKRTGVRVRILTGPEEARFAYLSAQRVLKRRRRFTMVIDVGGGSTEIVLGRRGEILSAKSYAMGALHLTEKYLHSDPVTEAEYAAMTSRVHAVVSRATAKLSRLSPSQLDVVVSGGTATTAAAMAHGRSLGAFERETLTARELGELERTCVALRISERRKLRGLPADRADIIVAGLSIVRAFVAAAHKRVVTVNDGGVRVGALIHVSRNSLRW